MSKPEGHLHPQQQAVFGAAGALLILALAGRTMMWPLIRSIDDRYEQLRSLQVRIADARLLLDRRGEQEAALREAQSRYQASARRVGTERSIAKILEALNGLAKAHRLELVAVQPRAEEESRPMAALASGLTLREIPLTLRVTGRYRQLGEFLGSLSGAPFLSSVRRFALTKPQAGSLALHAEMVLAVYLVEKGSS